MRRVVAASVLGLAARGVYRGVASGALTIDTGVARRLRPLGPVSFDVAAPRELVFDVIAAPYLGKTPQALRSKLDVLERGSDLVLAAHFTAVGERTTTTVETVRFTRPERIDFRVVRGPVPHVVEAFLLEPTETGTRLTWEGEMGTDFGALGAWWGDRVERQWERAVRHSVAAIAAEAERRAS